jgi:hypothetical protein
MGFLKGVVYMYRSNILTNRDFATMAATLPSALSRLNDLMICVKGKSAPPDAYGK